MKATFLITAAALLASGCASQEPVPEPKSEFGSSVREMIRAQTFNPLAGKAAQPPAGMDGDKAAAALKQYRSEKGPAGSASTLEPPIALGSGQ